MPFHVHKHYTRCYQYGITSALSLAFLSYHDSCKLCPAVCERGDQANADVQQPSTTLSALPTTLDIRIDIRTRVNNSVLSAEVKSLFGKKSTTKDRANYLRNIAKNGYQACFLTIEARKMG